MPEPAIVDERSELQLEQDPTIGLQEDRALDPEA